MPEKSLISKHSTQLHVNTTCVGWTENIKMVREQNMQISLYLWGEVGGTKSMIL